MALLVATALAIYKPRGMTRYGARKEQRQASGAPRWAKLLVGTLFLVLLVLRLFTHSGGHSPSGG